MHTYNPVLGKLWQGLSHNVASMGGAGRAVTAAEGNSGSFPRSSDYQEYFSNVQFSTFV